MKQTQILSRLFDMEDQAAQYWGGFLAADGTLQMRASGACELRLVSSEAEPIEKLKAFLGSMNKVRMAIQRDRANPDVTAKAIQGGKALYSFGIGATDFTWELEHYYGITANKSLTYAPGVCQTAAFWRGFIDGDGWVCSPKSRLGIGGTIDMCGAFAAFIKTLGIQEAMQLNAKRARPDFYIIETTRRKILEPLLHALYADSTGASRLSRKYLKAQDILKISQFSFCL
jgi:hypothetical protein